MSVCYLGTHAHTRGGDPLVSTPVNGGVYLKEVPVVVSCCTVLVSVCTWKFKGRACAVHGAEGKGDII